MEEEAAWAELLRRLMMMTRALGRRNLITEPSDAEDVAADVISRLQEADRLRRVARAVEPGAYLYAMLFHQAVELDRGRRRRRLRDAAIEEALGRDSLTDPTPTALEFLLAEEDLPRRQLQVERLRTELGRMAPDERRVVRERFWEGRSIREIADGLGVPYATVASRLYRLLGRLRARLGPE
jgi:RNA polymerase sigma factor (sigma-70 family)